MKKTKQRKWAKYKNSKANRHLVEYRQYCKSFEQEIIKVRSSYEEKKFHNKGKNPKQFFNFIRNNTESKEKVALLINDNILHEKYNAKCAALSNHYKTVYTTDNQMLPECTRLMPEDSFTDLDLTESDIVEAMKDMNSDNSPGYDNMFPKLLKNISCYILSLFRKSMQDESIPNDWITSIIVPVYKRNRKPNACASYRPINLTCCVSKIFERIIHKKMLQYLKENDLIYESQHGFLTMRLTITNLLSALLIGSHFSMKSRLWI